MGVSIVPTAESTAVRPPISPPPKSPSAEKPTAAIYDGIPMTIPRILSPEEHAQALNLPSHALAQANFPLLPPVPTAAAEATRTGQEPANPLAKHLTGIGRILSEYGFEPLARGLDYSPLTTVASLSPPGAIVGAAVMLHDMAQYAGQKAAEQQLDAATRKLAEADPDRIPGERAAVEAIMLGAAPLIHAGVKAFRGGPAGVPMDVETRQRVFAGLDAKTQAFVKNDPTLRDLFDPPPNHPSLQPQPPAAPRLETQPFDHANPTAPITPFDVAHPDIPQLRALNKSVPSTHLIDTPERQQLREQVTTETLRRGAQWADQGPHQGVVQGQEAHIVVGPPAAGKSSQLAEPIAAQFGGRVIDADIAKEQLPEFDHGRMAGAVHVESGDIMQEAVRRAASNGDNLVLPVVGKTLANVQDVIRALAEQGYKVHLYLADLGPDQAAGRAVARFLKENRFVDPHYVLHDVGTKPQENFQHLLSNPEPNVESYAHFNADVPRGAPYQLVDAGSVDRPGRLGARSPGEGITPGHTPVAATEPQAGEVAGSIAPAEPARLKTRAGSLVPLHGSDHPFLKTFPGQEHPLAGTKVVDESGQPKRVYHGTGAAFDSFDMAKNDPNALYGPGLYFTEDPNVAGGVVAEDGGIARKGYTQKGRGATPNVRPARLAIKNPFDADAILGEDNAPDDAHILSVGEHFHPDYDWDFVREQVDRASEDHNVDGGEFWRILAHTPDEHGVPIGKRAANDLLKSAGYDGITHIGGGTTGGAPHRVWIAFDPAQVRSAYDPAAPRVGAVGRANPPRQAAGTAYTAPLDAGDNPRMLNVAKLGLSPEGEAQLRAMLPATGEKTKVTHAETEALARELELDPERLHRRIGDWSGAEALAAQSVMSQNTERIVQLSKVTQDMTKPLAEREAAQGEITRLTGDVRTMAGRLAGERSKMGRDLNALKIIAKNTMDPSVWLAQAERVRGGLPLTPEHQTEILRLTGMKDRAGLVSYISGLAKTSNVDKALGLWKAGLLTGLRTHEVNIASNVAMAGLESAKDIPAVIIDRIASMVSGERTIAPSFRGNVIEASKGVGKGFRAAMKVVKQGDPATMERWDFRKTNFDSPVLQAYHDAVFRSLSAEDAIARGAAMGRALEEHSRIRARVLADADPSKTFQQHLEAIRQNPPDDVVTKAVADAEYAVFQNDNALARGMSAFKKQLPDAGRAAADVVLPFVKTPTNVAMRMADYSPIGFFTTLAKQLTEPSQRNLAHGLGRAVTGSSLVWLGYTLASEGKATGAASTAPGQRDLQAMQGAGANRVRMGKKWVDVSRVSPAGALVAVGSQLYHATHTGEPQTPSERAGAGAFSLGKVVLDQPMVSGLSNAVDAIKDPAHAGGRFIARTAGSVVPTIVSDAASAMDPNQRDVSGMTASVEARVPGLRDNLPAKLDAFGHPVPNQNQGANAFLNALNVSDAKDDPLVGELLRLQVSLPQPGKTITVGKVSHDRSDEARRTLKQVIGAEVEKRLRKVLTQDAYQVLTDEEKKVVLERVIGNVRGTQYAAEKARVRRGERAATAGATNTPSGAQ